MERKGLFTPEQEGFLAEALDFFFKFDNKLIETFDKQVFAIMVKTLDNKGLEQIPPTWKEKIIPVIDAALLKDFELVKTLAVEAINTPLGDEIEYLVYDTFAAFAVAAIALYTEKKKAKEEESEEVKS